MLDESEVPILFIAFNRPDLTAIVFDRIRAVRPRRLFVAVDGPRPHVPGDAALVRAVRKILERVDWSSDIECRYQDRNLGCMRGVSEAITWFFERVEAGVILEDDCLPNESFFRYCGELLERYADHQDVMHVGGTNPLPPHLTPASYYFSKYNRIWGWATWRRAWRHFDAELSLWPAAKARGEHLRFFPDQAERRLWEGRWDRIHAGANDTWDHQWFLCRLLRGHAIVPMANLVSNLGFRADAVHTTDPSSDLSRRPRFPLPDPLVHPESVRVDVALDRRFYEAFVASRVIPAPDAPA